MLIRIAGPPVFGGSAVLDLILAILIGSNLSRALIDIAPLFETMVATAAIVFVHWLLARLAFRYRWISWLVRSHRVRLVRRGEIDWAAMRSNAMIRGDLLDAAREAGIHEVGQIAEAYLQRNGKILVTGRSWKILPARVARRFSRRARSINSSGGAPACAMTNTSVGHDGGQDAGARGAKGSG